MINWIKYMMKHWFIIFGWCLAKQSQINNSRQTETRRPTGQLVVFREGWLCESPSVTAVSSQRPPAQLNHLLTYITAPRPRPPLCVYSPNPFLQQMTGSPTEPVRRSWLRCITMRAHPIMQRGKEANLVAAQLSTQRHLRRHSADPTGGGGAGQGCYITGWEGLTARRQRRMEAGSTN